MTPAAPAGSHHPTSDEAAAPVAAAGSHHPTSDDDAAPVAIAGDDLLPYYCNHNEDPQKDYSFQKSIKFIQLLVSNELS